MPPQRNPLALRDGNRLYNHEFIPYKRGLILGARKFGGTVDEIADAYNVPEASVWTTITREAERCRGETKARNGRPLIYTA